MSNRKLFMTVDLGALCANYRLLAGRSSAVCAAVVKADAYGLGVAAIAPALRAVGCEHFFVATAEEGCALRPLVAEAEIYVLNGYGSEELDCFREAALIPVLDTEEQMVAWFASQKERRAAPYAVQVDTGMSRLGLAGEEFLRWCFRWREEGLSGPCLVMSHLACAEQPGHPMNARQRARFASLLAGLPGVRASLANSSAIFLGEAFHFDLLRPGVALYGVNPLPGRVNPMSRVVTIQAPVIQVRTLRQRSPVGYGATATLPEGSILATVAAGYADGYPRSAANRAFAVLHGVSCPVVGMVSMDLITLDVTALRGRVAAGDMADLVGAGCPLEDLAQAADTIGYELLPRFGAQAERSYR